MNNINDLPPLFTLVPSDQPETETASDLTGGLVKHVFRLQRDPINMDELAHYKNIAILMSNGSLTMLNIESNVHNDDDHYVINRRDHPLYHARKTKTNVSFLLDEN